MRFVLVLIIFLMAGVTVTGTLITALLAVPFPGKDVQELFGWVALGGFALALPISYIVASNIIKNTSGARSES